MNGPNVLLLVLDSVRAKNVGLYGHHRETAPFLAEYGERATVYRQARSPGIHSVASHASLWTGAEVDEHRVIRHEDELKPGTTIWEELGEAGYETGIFTTNPVVAHASNLAEPFDTRVTDSFVDTEKKLFPSAHGPTDVQKHEGVVGNLKRCLGDDRPVRALANSAYHFVQQQRGSLEDETTSEDLVAAFDDWTTDVDGPWAACINLMDAHFPYEPSESHDRWGGEELRALHGSFDKPPANEFIGGRPWWQLEAFEHLYDGTIRQVDAHVERIVDALADNGIHDDTLVVVTSDHGEGFGEISPLTGRTRLVDHSWGIDEELTHVPLVVKYPGQNRGEVVDELASLKAFPDTVRAALDGDVESDSFVPDGPVVASTYRLREQDAMIFDGSDEDPEDYFGPWRAVYRREDGDVYKYAKRKDDARVTRIRDAQRAARVDRDAAEVVRTTFDGLEPADIKRAEGKEISDDVEDRLTELGYIR